MELNHKDYAGHQVQHPIASSSVNCVAQGGQDTLVGHLGHGWMSVDGASNIFEQCSHFESKGPFTNQLTDVSPNALDPKDSMIVFSSADSNESS